MLWKVAKQMNRYMIEATEDNLDICIDSLHLIGAKIVAVSVVENKYLILYRSEVEYSLKDLMEVSEYEYAKQPIK